MRQRGSNMTTKPPVPPFTNDSAIAKVRAAENAWNTRDAEKVALAYTPDSRWRNRDRFIRGRDEITAFLKDKWARELDYRLIKSLWAFDDNVIAVRFAYEYRTQDDVWFRAYGNEMWRFDANGLMARREASINDVRIAADERLFVWPAGPRPEDHPGLDELDL